MAASCLSGKLFLRFGKQLITPSNGVGKRGFCKGPMLLCSRQAGGEKWDLYSAVCLERPAKLITEKTRLEEEYQEVLHSMELERALLSNHELRHKDDLIMAERRKAEDYEDTQAEATRVTAVEAEDGWEAELAGYTPAPTTTAGDESGDKTTPNRELDRRLTLLVQQTLGEKHHWVLPQGKRLEGETMRQAAERILTEKCGGDMTTTFLGNAPVGFYKYRYPETLTQHGALGAKVFFFKAFLREGQAAKASDDIRDLAWLTRDELVDQLEPKYRDKVTRFIVEL